MLGVTVAIAGGGAWGYRVIGDPMSVAWHAHGVNQCRECDQRRMIEEKTKGEHKLINCIVCNYTAT